MLNYLCKSRTNLSKWKRIKDLRVYKNCGWGVENSDQILPREGIYGCFSTDGGIDHGDQGGGHLDHRNSAHESAGDKPRQITNDTTSKSDDRRVSTVSFGEHLVGEPGPGIPCLV